MNQFKAALLLLVWTISANAQVVVNVEFDSSVSPMLKETVTQDLLYLYQLRATNQSQLHQNIFGNFDGANFKRLFENKFRHVKLHDNCGGGVLCVIPYLTRDTLYLNSNYYPGIEPQIARIAQYIFALRVESTHPVSCPTPFLNADGSDVVSIYRHVKMAGETACDKTKSGGYGSAAIFLGNLMKYCTNCQNDVLSASQLLFDYYLQRVLEPSEKQAISRDVL